MLAIRMQRTGRKGHPMYRMIVQESHRQPTSGRIVALLGSYNPHTKEVALDKEKVEFYLKNGAQPSDRSIKVLTGEKIDLPGWVSQPSADKKKTIKNSNKLRRNRKEEPAEPTAEAQEEASTPEQSEAQDQASEEAAPAETEAAETEKTSEKPVEANKTDSDKA